MFSTLWEASSQGFLFQAWKHGGVMLEEWSEQYRVKMTRGKQGTEDLVVGKFGEIAEGDGETLHLRLLAVPRDRGMNGALNARKKHAAAGELRPVHVTEHVYESVWGFHPDNSDHSRLAIELIAPKRRRQARQLSAEQRAALAARLAVARQNRTQIAA
jgi:hypothetical protein